MNLTTRWNTVRLEKKLSEALAYTQGDRLLGEYEQAASEVASETSERISASGRGGAHNSEFANIEHRAFRSAAGRYNVLVGWLNPPGSAREMGSGGKLWYQYQDSGFRLFGGSSWIEGVGATIDQRERLIEALDGVNMRYLGDVARIFNR